MLYKILEFLKINLLEESRVTYMIHIPIYKKFIRRIEKRARKDCINVAFILQEPSVWGSFKALHELMVEDDTINAIVLAVPQLTYKHYVKLEHINSEECYSFAKKLPGKVVYTYDIENKSWIDIESLNLDYVFYSRPYETYLPSHLRASRVSQYAKVCFIPYCFEFIIRFSCMYATYFFKNVYMTFCDNSETYNYLKRKLKYTFDENNIGASYQKIYNIGYAEFDLSVKQEGADSKLWKRERTDAIKRIVWTPRWTPDPKLGGSNFLKYKDIILGMALENSEETDFVFRPHPMTFKTFLEEGLISEQELKIFCDKIKNSQNVSLDQGADYLEMFYSSDILITDISSVMLDYVFTHKPIILCLAVKMPEDGYMAHMAEAFYIVESSKELRSVIQLLMNGNDPKKEKREALIKELRPYSNVSEQIMNYVKRDYFRADS